jgi:signal transduction histidine kinase
VTTTRAARLDRRAALSRAAVVVAAVPFVMAVYGVVVLGGGRVLGTGGRPHLALSVLATAVVAVSYEPLSARVRRLAVRLLHGDRATPYEVMVAFASRMAGALSVEDVLPATAEAAARVVRADSGEVRVFLPDGQTRTARWQSAGGSGGGERRGSDLVVPVSHAGEAVGELAVHKSAGPGLTPADERLMVTLATHAGLALHNVRLTAELEASLDRLSAQAEAIITARLGERRRLRRVIRSKVDRTLQLAAGEMHRAETIAATDPEGARVLLEGAATLVVEALDTLRELAQGVFPPLLAQRGVVRALEAHVAGTSDPVQVRCAPRLDLSGAGIGAHTAVYFCCVEATRLACQRAPSEPVVIDVGAGAGGSGISFTVSGRGLDFGPASSTGVSPPALQHLADRLEALGGDLTVLPAGHGAPGIAGRAPASPASSTA